VKLNTRNKAQYQVRPAQCYITSSSSGAVLPHSQLLVKLFLALRGLATFVHEVTDALVGPGLALRQFPPLHDAFALRRLESWVLGRARVPSVLTAGLLPRGALVSTMTAGLLPRGALVSTMNNAIDDHLPRGLES